MICPCDYKNQFPARRTVEASIRAVTLKTSRVGGCASDVTMNAPRSGPIRTTFKALARNVPLGASDVVGDACDLPLILPRSACMPHANQSLKHGYSMEDL